MKSQILDEVIACLPKGKTHYRYYRGAYAPRLLSLLLPEQSSLRAIKQSHLKGLLEHQILKPLIAACGNGVLTRADLANVWQEPSQPFLLSVASWGGMHERDWYQTSRFGKNLVLQLNLPVEHQRKFSEYIDPSDEQTINGMWSSHPVQLKNNNRHYRDTLAWSRIDLDFEHDEALIEEIQSDGVRNVKRWAQSRRRCGCSGCSRQLGYLEWFDQYSKIWSEALLMATIEFINNELGIRRIYMHTARSGWQVKRMDKDCHAPRSLYSDMPKKFAFKQTWAAPEFLLETRCYKQLIRKQPDIDFHLLDLNQLESNGGVICQANA